MAPSFIVKNTFICVVGEEALSPVRRCRRKAVTEFVAFAMLRDEPGPASIDAEEGPASGRQVTALTQGFEAGGPRADAACAGLARVARSLATDAEGARLLRRGLDLGGHDATLAVAEQLKGSVCEAATSLHAHTVLEEIICRASIRDASFIAQELSREAPAMALNAHGNSVICRLLEFSPADACTVALVDAVLTLDVSVLCLHKSGYNVAMSILSNGAERHRRSIVATLRRDVQRFARHRFGCQVIVEALVHCGHEHVDHLARELTSKPSTVSRLACHAFGVQVVVALLDIPWQRKHVLQELCSNSKRLMKDKFGRALLQDLGLVDQDSALPLAAATAGA